MTYKILARTIESRDRSIKYNDARMLKHIGNDIKKIECLIETFIEYDTICTINMDKSTINKFVIELSVNRYSKGSCDYTVIVTPSMLWNISLEIIGYDILDIKDELCDDINEILRQPLKRCERQP